MHKTASNLGKRISFFYFCLCNAFLKIFFARSNQRLSKAWFSIKGNCPEHIPRMVTDNNTGNEVSKLKSFLNRDSGKQNNELTGLLMREISNRLDILSNFCNSDSSCGN